DKHRVSPTGLFSSIGKGKHTSDDSSRHRLVGPAINQSCLHCPFLFLQSSRPIKARIQLYPYTCPHLKRRLLIAFHKHIHR
ncbi:unnamed protein product, partial [Hymenolepis diminuta]